MNHTDYARPGDCLARFDFEAHNADSRAAWDAYNAGKPTRTPIIFGISTRYFMPIDQRRHPHRYRRRDKHANR